jgi:hypothetical protein
MSASPGPAAQPARRNCHPRRPSGAETGRSRSAWSPVDNTGWPTCAARSTRTSGRSKPASTSVIRRRNERFSITGDKPSAADRRRLRTSMRMARTAVGRRNPARPDRTEQRAGAPHLAASEGPDDGPQLITRKTELHGRTPRQVEYLKATSRNTTSPSASARPAPARPISPSPRRSMPSSAIWSSASS